MEYEKARSHIKETSYIRLRAFSLAGRRASRKTGFRYVLLTWRPSREIPEFLQRVSITRSFRPTSSVNRLSALFLRFTDDYGRVYPRVRTSIAAGEHLVKL